MQPSLLMQAGNARATMRKLAGVFSENSFEKQINSEMQISKSKFKTVVLLIPSGIESAGLLLTNLFSLTPAVEPAA